MILDDLGSFLQAQGVGTVGTTLFKGLIPEDAPLVATQDSLVALVEVPGLPPVHVHSQAAASYEQPVVQVLTRGVPYGYAAARTKAHQAYVTLDGVQNQTLSGTQYLWIAALQSPFLLKWDDLARPLIAFSVRCAKAL